MGFFSGGETKEEKQARKQQEMLAKYGLQNLTDSTDIASCKKIVEELVGTGMQEFGITLGGGNEKDIARLQLYYQRAILEQNFIMIRQLDKIASTLKDN